MTKLFKALGATLLAAGLVVAGVAAPAQATVAATASISVNSFTANSTVSSAVTLSFTDTAATSTSTYAQISLVTLALPSGCQTTNTLSVCGISSINVNGAPAPSGTSIEKVNPGIFKVILPSATIINSMSVAFSANQLTVGSTVGNADVTWQAVSGGTNVAQSGYTVIANSGGGGSMVNFSGTGALVDASSNALSNFAVASPVPAFTISGSSFTNNATYSKVGVMFYRNSPSAEYFTLANTVSTTATPGAWSPNNASCGVTAISLGGTPQTGSSGILCQKESWSFMSTTGYAIRIFLPSETSAAISISVGDNVFTSATAGSYGARLSMTSAVVNGSFFSGGTSVPVTVSGSSSNSSSNSQSASSSASLSLGISTGGVVAGAPVAISASGLQSTAAYDVVVQSSPQTIGSGNAVNGAVNTSFNLPSNLESGWHTLTFSSTASDGSAVVSKYYFKVSASGTLLSTSSTIPTELVNTGLDSPNMTLFLLGGLSLALIGAEMIMIARRKRSN